MFYDFLPLILFAVAVGLGISLNSLFASLYDNESVNAESYSEL